MLRFYKKLILLTLFVLFQFITTAQTSFSKDKEKFIDELEKFIAKTNEDEASMIMAELRALWPMDAVTPKKEEKIYKQANAVYQARLKKLKAESTFIYGFDSGKLNDYQIQMIIMMCNKMIKKE